MSRVTTRSPARAARARCSGRLLTSETSHGPTVATTITPTTRASVFQTEDFMARTSLAHGSRAAGAVWRGSGGAEGRDRRDVAAHRGLGASGVAEADEQHRLFADRAELPHQIGAVGSAEQRGLDRMMGDAQSGRAQDEPFVGLTGRDPGGLTPVWRREERQRAGGADLLTALLGGASRAEPEHAALGVEIMTCHPARRAAEAQLVERDPVATFARFIVAAAHPGVALGLGVAVEHRVVNGVVG